MKKILSFILVIIMILSLVACGNTEETDTKAKNDKETTEETKKETDKKEDKPEEETEINNSNDDVIDELPVAEDFEWTLENGVLTISGNGKMPDFFEEKNYIGLDLKADNSSAPWLSRNEEIVEIEIREGISNISYGAFAFLRKLNSVSIPDSVKVIEDSAFFECLKLTDVKLPSDLTKIGAGAFFGCGSLETIDIPDSVTDIGEEAFSLCFTLSISKLPENLETVGDRAFEECIIDEITLPASLRNIGTNVFDNIKNIYTDENNENFVSVEGVLFTKDKKELIVYPTGRSDKSYAVPNGVENIRSCAFEGSLLTEIILPEGLVNIGERAFGGSDIVNITLPDSVKSIGNQAFAGCMELEKIDLSDGLTEIGEGAFDNCIKIKRIDIPSGVTNIKKNLFDGCRDIECITIPASVTSIDMSAYPPGFKHYVIFFDGTVEEWENIVYSYVDEDNNPVDLERIFGNPENTNGLKTVKCTDGTWNWYAYMN